MFLLDTDHITHLQRRADSRLRDRIKKRGAQFFYVSIVSFHEQVGGWISYLHGARTGEKVLHAYRMFEKILHDFTRMQVVAFDETALTELSVRVQICVRGHRQLEFLPQPAISY